MNPFEWGGPEFLVFYFVLAAMLLAWQYFRGRQRESQRTDFGKPNLTDAYEIAYLRGGRNELLRVACVSLIERCQLELDAADRLSTVRGKKPTGNAVDDYILSYYATPDTPHRILKAKPNSQLRDAMNVYRNRLEKTGLLCDQDLRRGRLIDCLQTVLALLFIAGIKLMVAISQGRRNIGFLIAMGVISIGISLVFAFQNRLTNRGRRAIEDMQTLFDGLRSRSGLGPAEVALTAAIFGMTVLPGMGVLYANRIYPQGSSSSSSCGSSSDSGGGSDGGGGSSCGGGGGCGGCGGGGD